jgi:hypothetical protein
MLDGFCPRSADLRRYGMNPPCFPLEGPYLWMSVQIREVDRKRRVRIVRTKEAKENIELTDLSCVSAQGQQRAGRVVLHEVVDRIRWFECFEFGSDALNDEGCL